MVSTCRDETIPTPLKQLLDGHRMSAAVAMHWVMFGSSGRKKRPAEGGVLARYTKCNAMPIKTVKVIVNTWFVLRDAGHPHNFYYRCAWLSCMQLEHHGFFPVLFDTIKITYHSAGRIHNKP
jgi:hypothetical protein